MGKQSERGNSLMQCPLSRDEQLLHRTRNETRHVTPAEAVKSVPSKRYECYALKLGSCLWPVEWYEVLAKCVPFIREDATRHR
jgi:hypothetical protein